MKFSDATGPKKRRTREHIIADLSVNHVERFILRRGWTAQRTTHDYGIDLYMKTYNADGEPEQGPVSFQLKATDKLKVRRNGKFAAVRVESRDIQAWRKEPMPVILILYDACQDKAYWLHIQSYFNELGSRLPRRATTITVYIPRDHELNEAAVNGFGEIRAAVMATFPRVYDE